ncbi:AI-2E family transporter [Rubrimonas sp.]|uniref:AI-2E family transporter n=1 Tax=Rubrimonas sp. TaxID=2036015 RepID=UPI002FDE38A3
MTLGEQARWWGLALLALIVFLWAFSSAITPFLAGMAIAYFLDPLADRLERLGLSRVAATAVISALAGAAAVSAMVVLVPLLLDQINQFVRAAPGYVATAQDFIERMGAQHAPDAFGEGGVLAKAFDQFEQRLQEFSVALLERAWTGGLALIDFIALAVITPVVAFYLLLDWDRMIDEIDHWLPRRHAPVIRRIASDIDRVLAGFVRGQFTVCLILGAFYATALAILGLNFGLVVGLFAGLISFIPFVGSLLGGAISIGLAVLQFWNEPVWILAVAAVFLVGQAVEGNYLTPKLVGSSVGLHPVWLMFALSAFGAAMGFTGLLIAVPAAAAIGVFVRFGLEQYKAGRLYTGGEQLLPDDPDHERDAERAASE